MFKSQEKLIAEIHNEFDTAQERLLEQANQLLESLEVPTESNIEQIASRLERVGFTSTPVVQRAADLKKRREESQKLVVTTKEQAELINYYKFTYPFLKFLTEDELNRICEKYSLIHAPTKNYIKEVPEKNLLDIEQSQGLKELDTCAVRFRIIGEDKVEFMKFLYSIGKSDNEFSVGEDLVLLNKFSKDYHYERNLWGFNSSTWLFCLWEDAGRIGKYNVREIQQIDKSGLFIAAPESHFNLKGLDKKSKHGFFEVFKTEVKDPIVFRYVRGGVQVLTKWGTEGEDPMLYNEKLN
jgi:hypothetical protein